MNKTSRKLKLASKIIRKALSDYKKEFILIVILGLLAGLSGGIGIGVIVPLFSILIGQSAEESDVITQTIEKIFSFLHLPFNLSFLAMFIVFLFLFKAMVQFSARYVNGKVAAQYEEKLRGDLFSKTLNASWPYLLNQKTGFLERVLMNDVFKSANVITTLTNLILLGTSLIMYAFVAFNISSLVTILTIGLGAILFFIFKPLYYKSRKTAKEAADIEKITAHYLSENILSSKAIKASVVESKVVKIGKEYFEKLKEKRIRAVLYASSVGPSFEPAGIIFILILFIFYHRLPGFNLISFAATVYLVQKMFSFIESSQGNIQRLSELIPYLQSVIDYRTLASSSKEISGGSLSFNLKHEITLDNLTFSYMGRETVLSGLNFSIRKGEMVGLVGPSGIGKTTVADLLLRLFQPDSGRILLDRMNAEDIDIKSWRKKIGYVSQDVFLLNDTVENNIKFFDDSISEENIVDATEAANARDFIQKLPDGLNTVVGERGVKLSNGQRQRIALARVLAKNPEVLILDEATSALDSESELLVNKAIQNLRGVVTILVITHHLSTVMNSDRVLVLENGKIAESGTPKELFEDKNSRFYKIYNISEEWRHETHCETINGRESDEDSFQ